MNQATPSKHQRINAIALRNLMWMLHEGPHDYYEMAETTGLAMSTIRRWLSPFRRSSGDTPRLVYIATWNEDARGYPTRPAFAWGPGKRDAKAAVKSAAERKRKYRAARALRVSSVFRLGGESAP